MRGAATGRPLARPRSSAASVGRWASACAGPAVSAPEGAGRRLRTSTPPAADSFPSGGGSMAGQEASKAATKMGRRQPCTRGGGEQPGSRRSTAGKPTPRRRQPREERPDQIRQGGIRLREDRIRPLSRPRGQPPTAHGGRAGRRVQRPLAGPEVRRP
ncbi:hypothetical protein PVAP13_4KG382402 [Panicum virgatum]|uniref:Uncharacterized protein n=1 Tax=Panicum virgatum TaxID=38727 RepID=A0A8T0TY26_PANVG|nr:hypothetical protein PVAP13_4KG382402 [Panicum virgatum]